jgi:cytoskeletal protein RodZ
MDTITHLTNKIMAERAHQPVIHQAIDTAPPPPYTETSDTDEDSDDDDEEEPMKLVINANHTVHGSNNLVPTSPSTLADATKFSAILLSAVTQLNNAVAAANAQTGQLHCLRVDLTINCGIAVVGDRNVIGNIGLKPKAPTLTPNGFTPPAATGDAVMGAESAVAGAKRKANDDDENVSSIACLLPTVTHLADRTQTGHRF